MTPTRKAAKPARAYHHGDLKRALIDAAVGILRSDGVEALTLRAVARSAGVSANAPYRHFPDRRSLVAAVAQEGFARLHAQMLAGIRSAEGRLGFKQVAVSYVRFALENPAEYRVMFGPEVAATGDLPELRHQARGVLEFVAFGIDALQKAGAVGPGDPSIMAAALWASLHGLVMLSLDGQTQGVAPSLDALVEETTRIMMFGMAPRAPAP